jgi:glycosyltransferase involved in cell wall biosynthesis
MIAWILSHVTMGVEKALVTTMKTKPTISVVIPVYNSQQTLAELVDRLQAVMEAVSHSWEVILVNDGSRDQSWQVIRDLAARYAAVRGLDLMRNYGQHNALLAGVGAARHEVIVTLDDDLQNPPEEIPKLLAKLDEGYDVVYGTPQQEQHGLWRDLASRVTKLALQASMGVDVARKVSAFRAFRAQVREGFVHYQGPYASLDVLLTWGTNRFAAVPVRHEPRKAGASNYTFRKLLVHAVNMATGFSVLPLQLASLMGFGFTLFGLLVLLYVLGRYFLEGGSVAGFPFLASIIAIFSGAQLLTLGIFGEYLARMHFRLMDKPTYVIRSVTEDS